MNEEIECRNKFITINLDGDCVCVCALSFHFLPASNRTVAVKSVKRNAQSVVRMESSLCRNVWDGVGQETQAAGKGRFHCVNGKDPGVGRTPPEFEMKQLLIRINKKEEGKMCVISEWVKLYTEIFFSLFGRYNRLLSACKRKTNDSFGLRIMTPVTVYCDA